MLLSLLLIVIYSIHTYGNIFGQSQNIVNQEIHKPLEIIKIFYNAVDRGELVVFEQKLNKSMITPIRVEYVYELNGTLPTVNVYSEPKIPIPIRLHEGIKLRGISSIIDSDGRIIEIRAHVVQE